MNAELKARMEKLRKTMQEKKEQILSERNVDEPTLIKSIRGRYNLREEDIREHWLEILEIEKQHEKCRACNGLFECFKIKNKGFVESVGVVDTVSMIFDVSVSPCRYERQRREQAHIDRLLVSSGVPRIYEGLSFRDFRETNENKMALRSAHWVISDCGGDTSIYLYGSKGTGKTMLASIITNEIIRSGKTAVFSSVPDLMANLRASFKTDNTDEILSTVKNVPILILDDLGAERATEWVGEQLFSIVNARYEGRKQTIITSNFSPDELAAHFADKVQGGRIVSRIYGMCARVRITGKDWRMSA